MTRDFSLVAGLRKVKCANNAFSVSDALYAFWGNLILSDLILIDNNSISIHIQSSLIHTFGWLVYVRYKENAQKPFLRYFQ